MTYVGCRKYGICGLPVTMKNAKADATIGAIGFSLTLHGVPAKLGCTFYLVTASCHDGLIDGSLGEGAFFETPLHPAFASHGQLLPLCRFTDQELPHIHDRSEDRR